MVSTKVLLAVQRLLDGCAFSLTVKKSLRAEIERIVEDAVQEEAAGNVLADLLPDEGRQG